VEGYTDVISLVQAGIDNVVSSSGTALTQDQVRMIRRFTHNITVIYDGDAAGIQAAIRGLDLLLEEDMYVRLVMLPAEDDPDSLVRRLGRDAFLEFLKSETKDFILFKTGLLTEDSKNDPVKRSIMVREIVQSISLIPDPIRRATYLKECSSLLAMDERVLVQETAKAIKANLKRRNLNRESTSSGNTADHLSVLTETRDAPSQRRTEVAAVDAYQERNIVQLLIQSGAQLADPENNLTVVQYVVENIRDVLDKFDNDLYGRIVNKFADAWKEGRILRQEELRSDPDQEIADLALEIVAERDDYSENWLNSRNLPLLSQRPPEENYGLDSMLTVLRFKEFKIQKHIDANKVLIQQFEKEKNAEALNLHLKMPKELSRMKQELTTAMNSVGIRL
jgi:DNA primase